MTSKERLQTVLSHKDADRIALDFGATTVTGLHCIIVEKLREYYGLERRPVRIIDPFQMLGEVDDELLDLIGIDTIGIWGRKNMFDIDETRLHEQITPWGQTVLIAEDINLTPDEEGDVYIYAGGDCSRPPSAVMPDGCYFVNAIERQKMIDDDNLNPEDNLEEFGYITVIENVFGFKQVLPLQEGDNVIGRRCVGTVINTPIESGDMSMDRRHCIINVKRNKQGKLVYTLRDAPSLTGTFLMNEILGDKDRVRMEDGAIVTIGATTFILHTAEAE